MSKQLHYRLGAIVRVGTKYLLVRTRHSDNTVTSGYHVPSKPLTEANQVRSLKKFFSDYYAADVRVLGSLKPIVKGGDSLIGYLVEEESTLRFPFENFEYGFFSVREFKNMNIELADRVLLEKADLYLPLLRGEKRKVLLTPMEIDKINHMLDSLRYFSNYIPSEERKQFLQLVNSNISYPDLLKAYKYLLAQYEVNYFSYIDRANKGRPTGI